MQPVQKTAVRGKVVDTPVDASTTGAMGPDSAGNCLEVVAGSSDQFIDKVWKV